MFAPLMMDYSFLRVPVAARYVEKKKKKKEVSWMENIYTQNGWRNWPDGKGGKIVETGSTRWKFLKGSEQAIFSA